MVKNGWRWPLHEVHVTVAITVMSIPTSHEQEQQYRSTQTGSSSQQPTVHPSRTDTALHPAAVCCSKTCIKMLWGAYRWDG
jgi:hypothetical protein